MSEEPGKEIVSNYPRAEDPTSLDRAMMTELLTRRPPVFLVTVESLAMPLLFAVGFDISKYLTIIKAIGLLALCLTQVLKPLKLVAFIRRWSRRQIIDATIGMVTLCVLGLGFLAAIMLKRQMNQILAEAGLDRWGVEGSIDVWKESLDEWEKRQ